MSVTTEVQTPDWDLLDAHNERLQSGVEPKPQPDPRNSLLRFWPHIKQFRLPLGGSILLSFVAMMTGIVIPLITARIIDGPIADRHFGALWLPALVVLALGLVDAAGVWGRRWLVARPSSQFEINMRAKLFARLQTLSVGVHDGWDSGQLLSRAISDMSTMRRFVAFIAPFIVINTATVIVGFVALFVLDPKFGLVQLAIAIPLLFLCIRFERLYRVAARRAQDQTGDVATTVEEAVQGIRVVKAFGRAAHVGGLFTRQARDLKSTELLKVRYGAFLWSVMVSLPAVSIGLMLAVGAHAIVDGTMTLGTLVAGITLATFIQWPVESFGFLLAELNNARTAADRFWEIIDLPVDIGEPRSPRALPKPLHGNLRFDHVGFRFPDAERAQLDDVSLTIGPGETLALVGATGSGKTALLNLVPRLFDVTAGSITVDGVDIRSLRLEDLRSIVAVAFEEPVLFSASVRENVALGRPEASDDEVRDALEVAHATEFVDALPWGLDTRIGEQGLSLSGGQRQRLALARAVLSRPRILVLDDPLSALDVDTEERVQAALRRVLEHSTTLLVAHRPSTAALADRVAVLEDGRIIETGTHEHLLETSKRYRNLMGGVHNDRHS
ncbi:ABC transporter ATP-binding protein [Antrihabitans spumae]|uniref:ABC transporter ATP-binding protein n=1 Tax=Antrihabitans spumae TaxID=3373370 RepID=A0ABW7KX30_9NOCA